MPVSCSDPASCLRRRHRALPRRARPWTQRCFRWFSVGAPVRKATSASIPRRPLPIIPASGPGALPVGRREPGTSGMAALEARNLNVTYRKHGKPYTAVHDLSFTVEVGEVIGFIGPNGAGKSSTIRTLMGFQQPTSGEARLLGQPAGSREARRQVGFLPEVALYYPWLTPLETLHLYGRLAGLTARESRTQSQELLDRVGLKGREHDRLRGFSKGMLQRVGIAQSLLGKPRLLILDEVSSGLDPLGRRDLRNLMLEEKQKGVTIFFSSHELTEVAQLCDRVILLNKGRVLDERPVDTLLR
ncbi:MAG: ABC transporter ATP-binding protein, partial [Armatimonadetes bacterium]|nr:ABC transporter ATP-binding protein [Armatimonadota bacterium]